MSVQGQSRYPTRSPIDQRGEQTINRDVKSSGGIKFFASDQDSVLKWNLNRPFQAQNTEALYKMSAVNHANDEYKATRPSQILKSEKYVTDLVEVLRNDFMNPFDSNIDKGKLLNLSSGIPVNDDLAEDILKIKDRGIDSYNEFVEKRIKSQAIKVHDPIKRQKCALFTDTERKVTLKHKGNEKTIEVNRDVLTKLLALSAKHNKVIDFEAALTYPLSPVPLSLSHPDGTRRKTMKSSLMSVINSYYDTNLDLPLPPKQTSMYIVDLMALIRTVSPIPETYSHLVHNLIEGLPKNYKPIDIVADTYRENSLKNNERNLRGISDKVMISSSSSKIPRNFTDFLKNGDNKTRLIELIKDELVKNSKEILSKLSCEIIYFSMDNICVKISECSSCEVSELASNLKEADNKLLLHTKNSIHNNPDHKIVIRSPSGDIDINIVFINIFYNNTDIIWIDYGTGDNRRTINLRSIDIDSDKRSALIGFHAAAGNDCFILFSTW